MLKKMYRWERMPVYTDEWIKFDWKEFGVVKNMFKQNMKIKKQQKLINEVQKNKQNKTEKSVVRCFGSYFQSFATLPPMIRLIVCWPNIKKI